MNDIVSVLVLCTGNSARSQMAEGLLRHIGGNRFEVFSAGTHPSVVNPLAIEAMDELGINISQHRSKPVTEFVNEKFDYVITVCDNAKDKCPVFPGHAVRIHWSFVDPAMAIGTHEQKLIEFRRVRDEIAAQISEFASMSDVGNS